VGEEGEEGEEENQYQTQHQTIKPATQ